MDTERIAMAQDNKMDEIKISLDATGSDGEISVVRVDGVIDTMTATELEKVMSTLLDQKRYNIIIDLGGVDYISSAGWGIFISNIREIRQHSGDLKLAGMIPNVYEIYELLEFDTILNAFENIEKAKSEFNLVSDQDSEAEKITAPQQPTEVVEEIPEKEPVESPKTVQETESQVQPESSPERKTTSNRVEDRVVRLAIEDPFLSIWEMKKILNAELGSSAKLGWWKIRRILKENNILSKKKRFRYSRKV